MSFNRASKKDEQDLKEFSKAKATIEAEETTIEAEETTIQQTDVKGLQKVLKDKSVDFTTFANADESFRKRVLKEEYQATKTKYGWLYDQPIKADA